MILFYTLLVLFGSTQSTNTALLLRKSEVSQWECVTGPCSVFPVEWLTCERVDHLLKCHCTHLQVQVYNVTLQCSQSPDWSRHCRVSYSLGYRTLSSWLGALMCPLLQVTTDVWLNLVRLVSPLPIANLSFGCGQSNEYNGQIMNAFTRRAEHWIDDYLIGAFIALGVIVILLVCDEFRRQHPLQSRGDFGGVDLKLVLPGGILLQASNVVHEPGKETRLMLTQLMTQCRSLLCPNDYIRVGITSLLNKQRQRYKMTMLLPDSVMSDGVASALTKIQPNLEWRCQSWNHFLVVELQFEADLPVKRQQKREKKIKVCQVTNAQSQQISRHFQ